MRETTEKLNSHFVTRPLKVCNQIQRLASSVAVLRVATNWQLSPLGQRKQTCSCGIQPNPVGSDVCRRWPGNEANATIFLPYQTYRIYESVVPKCNTQKAKNRTPHDKEDNAIGFYGLPMERNAKRTDCRLRAQTGLVGMLLVRKSVGIL